MGEIIQTYYSSVKNGKIQNNIEELMAQEIGVWEGQRIEITRRKVRAHRTSQQNRFLHLLFTIFSKELIAYTGDKQYTPALIKDICKQKFLLEDVVNSETGEVIGQTVRHTADLNKSDFSDFVEEVKQYAMEQFHIYLPEAGEQLQMDSE